MAFLDKQPEAEPEPKPFGPRVYIDAGRKLSHPGNPWVFEDEAGSKYFAASKTQAKALMENK